MSCKESCDLKEKVTQRDEQGGQQERRESAWEGLGGLPQGQNDADGGGVVQHRLPPLGRFPGSKAQVELREKSVDHPEDQQDMDDLIGPPAAEPGGNQIVTDHEQDDGVDAPEKSIFFHIDIDVRFSYR